MMFRGKSNSVAKLPEYLIVSSMDIYFSVNKTLE